jgi:hypothetical protein
MFLLFRSTSIFFALNNNPMHEWYSGKACYYKEGQEEESSKAKRRKEPMLIKSLVWLVEFYISVEALRCFNAFRRNDGRKLGFLGQDNNLDALGQRLS